MTEVKFIKKIDKTIKIRVRGEIRILQNSDGVDRAVIEYHEALMNEEIDKALLPLLEEIVGFKHMVFEGELVPAGCALIGFRCALLSDSPLLRRVRNNNIKRIEKIKETQ